MILLFLVAVSPNIVCMKKQQKINGVLPFQQSSVNLNSQKKNKLENFFANLINDNQESAGKFFAENPSKDVYTNEVVTLTHGDSFVVASKEGRFNIITTNFLDDKKLEHVKLETPKTTSKMIDNIKFVAELWPGRYYSVTMNGKWKAFQKNN